MCNDQIIKLILLAVLVQHWNSLRSKCRNMKTHGWSKTKMFLQRTDAWSPAVSDFSRVAARIFPGETVLNLITEGRCSFARWIESKKRRGTKKKKIKTKKKFLTSLPESRAFNLFGFTGCRSFFVLLSACPLNPSVLNFCIYLAMCWLLFTGSSSCAYRRRMKRSVKQSEWQTASFVSFEIQFTNEMVLSTRRILVKRNEAELCKWKSPERKFT